MHQVHVSASDGGAALAAGGVGGGNAALMIWLGILIDAIPESLVIGFLAADPKV